MKSPAIIICLLLFCADPHSVRAQKSVTRGNLPPLRQQGKSVTGGTSKKKAPTTSQTKASPQKKSGQQTKSTATADVILIVGAPGEPKYAGMFSKWASRWTKAAQQGKAKLHRIGGLPQQDKQSDRDKLRSTLSQLTKGGAAPLWIVYIGHGTFDRKRARLNLTKRDVSAGELNGWLAEFQRPLVIVHCGAASAPFINRLSKAGRVIVTATKSGYESNFAYFGEFMSAAIADPKADLDKDQQVSLLEAFLSASRQVAEFYKETGRLATEQALIDDNGDARGTPASFFRGIRVAKQAAQGGETDGLRANQLHLVRSVSELALPPKVRAKRDALEKQLEQLRAQKGTVPEKQYYERLEKILIQIARLYNP